MQNMTAREIVKGVRDGKEYEMPKEYETRFRRECVAHVGDCSDITVEPMDEGTITIKKG